MYLPLMKMMAMTPYSLLWLFNRYRTGLAMFYSENNQHCGLEC